MSRLFFAPACAALVLTLSPATAVTVINGDFEANAAGYTVWPGYNGQGGVNPASPTGWTPVGPGGGGINPVSPPGPGQDPFNDGSSTGAFAFLQGTSGIDQDVTGFQVGSNYTLSLDFNARNCCNPGVDPIAEIFLDGTLLASSISFFPAPGGVIPASIANGGVWYHADLIFTAADTTITLGIRARPEDGVSDTTLIVDNISIVPEPGMIAMAFCALGAGLIRRRR